MSNGIGHGQNQLSESVLRARRAANRGNWLEAWQCWESARKLSPDQASAYTGSANALREMYRYDEAEAVLQEGAQRFPGDQPIAIGRASLAETRCIWPVTASRWERVLVLSADYAPAYAGLGNALREMHRCEEAETILEEGAQRFPDEEPIAITRARLADARAAWPAALKQWEIVRKRSPNNPRAFVGVVNALCHLERYEGAEAVLGEGMQRFPHDEHLAITGAWLANARSDWPTALSRWAAARARSPDHAPAYVGAGNALRGAHRYEEAELMLLEGIRRFPEDSHIAIARAWLANTRSDWPTAVSRWEAVRAGSPHDLGCYLGSIHALRGIGRHDLADALLSSAETLLSAAKHDTSAEAAALRREMDKLQTLGHPRAAPPR